MLLSLPSPDRPRRPETPASDELPLDDPGTGLPSLVEEDVSLDEEAATDLDIGFVIDEPLEPGDAPPDAGAELVLDIGELLDAEEGPEGDRAERDKPAELGDFGSDLEILEGPWLDASWVDEAEPLEEFEQGMEGIGGDLPDLQRDGGPELGAEADEDLSVSEPEAALSESESGWTRQHEYDAPRVVLALAGDTLVAAGDKLWWSLGEHPPERDPQLIGRVTSAAPLDPECLLLATLSGDVFRKRRGHAAERLDSWRASVSRSEGYVSVELSRAEKSEVAFLRLSTGALLESHDRGDSWKPVDLGGRVRACSRAGRFSALVENTHGGSRVVSALHAGKRELSLDGFAARLLESGSVSLAADDELVALGSFSAGVALWAGERFDKIPGCQSVTALTVGRVGARSVAWAALYSESEDLSRIVALDSKRARAEVILKIQRDAPEAEQGGEFEEGARVHALVWDGSRLWVASTAGVSSWSPSTSSTKTSAGGPAV